MSGTPSDDALDRHALVSAIWLPVGLLALGLFHYGFAGGGQAWVLAGFGAVLLGYGLHMIVNAVLKTTFTAAELALALVLYGAAGLALVFAVLLQPGFAQTFFLPVVLGMAALAAAVVFYLVVRWGPRQAFGLFDVIRDSNPRRASSLPHRGGRR